MARPVINSLYFPLFLLPFRPLRPILPLLPCLLYPSRIRCLTSTAYKCHLYHLCPTRTQHVSSHRTPTPIPPKIAPLPSPSSNSLLPSWLIAGTFTLTTVPPSPTPLPPLYKHSTAHPILLLTPPKPRKSQRDTQRKGDEGNTRHSSSARKAGAAENGIAPVQPRI